MKELKDYTKIKKDRQDCWRDTAFQMSSVSLQFCFFYCYLFAVFFGFHFQESSDTHHFVSKLPY